MVYATTSNEEQIRQTWTKDNHGIAGSFLGQTHVKCDVVKQHMRAQHCHDMSHCRTTVREKNSWIRLDS